jgi:hypothetical protein
MIMRLLIEVTFYYHIILGSYTYVSLYIPFLTSKIFGIFDFLFNYFIQFYSILFNFIQFYSI